MKADLSRQYEDFVLGLILELVEDSLSHSFDASDCYRCSHIGGKLNIRWRHSGAYPQQMALFIPQE